ncbi:hypothetical protein [Legionella rowbothamii]|uniref:hypothetical protein n=1 Tax=Legionella rowbothamii TaxID=96229 RepID=UPI001055D8FE|nr:hypothetical protein [Legionella rowbothamii]
MRKDGSALKYASEELQNVLDKTTTLLSNKPSNEQLKDYASFVQASLKNPLSGMQLLDKLMMALSVAVAGASLSLASTGVGVLPAVGAGLLSARLFAAGAYVARKGALKDDRLIETFKQAI